MATSKPSAGTASSAGVTLDPAVILQHLVNMSGDDAMAGPIRLLLSAMRPEDSPQATTTSKNSRKPTRKTEREAHENKKIKEHKNWECHVCNRFFNDPSNFRRHVQRIHRDEQLSKQTREKNKSKSKAPKKKRWPCEWCKKTFCSNGNLKTHLNSCQIKVNYEDNEDNGRISDAEYQPEDGEDGRNSSNTEYQPDVEDDDEESVNRGHEGQVRESEDKTVLILYMCLKCEAVAIDMDTAVEHSQIHHQPDYVPVLVTCDVCHYMFEAQHLDNHSQIHDHIEDGFLGLPYNPYRFLDNDWPDRIRNLLETSAMDIETSQVQQEG